MLFQTPPAPPPAATVMRSEARFVTAAARDIPLVLTNKAGRVESATARYQLFIKTQVQTLSSDKASPECVWTLSTHLQRQLCFSSMTGQFACADLVLSDQPEGQSGHTQLAGGADPGACGLATPSVTEAERKLSQAVAASATSRFDSDLKLSVMPAMTRSGVSLKRGG